jgi:hypothetical protein
MTKRDYAILGCRILALYLFAQAILSLGAICILIYRFAGSATSSDPAGAMQSWTKEFISYGLFPLIMIVTSLAIWKMAPFLAGRLIRNMSDVDLPPAIPPGGIGREGAMEVALVVLGMYLTVMALPGIFVFAYGAILSAGDKQYLFPALDSLISYLVQLVIGVCLVVGTRRLISFISRLRTAGIKKSV